MDVGCWMLEVRDEMRGRRADGGCRRTEDGERSRRVKELGEMQRV